MARRQMLFPAAFATLRHTMSKSRKDPSRDSSSFRTPPLWIHASEAGKWLRAPREARKRAVIRLLDRLPPAPRAAPKKAGA